MANPLFFNGINGANGRYLLPELDADTLSSIIRGEPVDEEQSEELKAWYKLIIGKSEKTYAPKAGVDFKDLSQTGWGVVVSPDCDPAVLEALKPLLDHRREQASKTSERRYRVFAGLEDGVRRGQSKNEWLDKHGMGPGPADPDRIPYYLLLVGDPTQIPYRFQSQLDVQYGVGRIHFDTLDEYANYAKSVVEAEKQQLKLPRRIAMLGVAREGDPSTETSAQHLIQPLAEQLRALGGGWAVETHLGQHASKADFCRNLGGADTPALFFSASHGIGFPNGDPRQLPHQGALITQDWPGPEEWRDKEIPPDWYFSRDDLTDTATLWGLMAFFFACYGAGTPFQDEFAQQAFRKQRVEIAPAPFVAALPKRMLSHPKGGALAVIGHVERSWGYSFIWGNAGRQLAVYQSTLQWLLEGYPIGAAMEYFNMRYSELSSDLSVTLEDMSMGKKVSSIELSGMWTANNDARNFVVLGDPAVRLAVDPKSKAKITGRPSIQLSPIPPQVGLSSAPKKSIPVEPLPESSPVEISAATPRADVDYTVMQDVGKSLETFVKNLGKFLGDAIAEAATLKVRTYTSSQIDTVDVQNGKVVGGRLRAITFLNIDGDIVACVPENEDGTVDKELWDIHKEMVQQASDSRAELVKAAVSAITSLRGGGE